MADHNLTVKIGTELDEESVRRLSEKLKTELDKINTKDSDKAYRESTRGIDFEKREQSKAYKSAMKDLKDYSSQQQKSSDIFKNWRKTLTGVLIDLHIMRVIASQSRIVSINMNMLGRALGYLLDMILLPMLPSLLAVSKFVIGLAMALSKLPAPLRALIALIGSIVIAIITTMTVISISIAIYRRLNAQLLLFSANLSRANIAGGAGGAGGMMSVVANPIAIGALIGLIGVFILHQSGALNKVYESGKATRKWLDKNIGNIGIKFSQLIALLGVWFGKFIEWIGAGAQDVAEDITSGAGAVIDIGKLIWDFLYNSLMNALDLGQRILDAIVQWVWDSLLNTIDAGKKILDTFVEWVRSGFQDPLGFINSIKDILLEWIIKETSITTTFAMDVINALVDFVKRQLGINEEAGTVVSKLPNLLNLDYFTPAGGLYRIFKDTGLIPSFASGGVMPYDGLAYLHKNETVTPEGSPAQTSVTVNLVVNGAMDNRTIDEVIRKLKLELSRVRG